MSKLYKLLQLKSSVVVKTGWFETKTKTGRLETKTKTKTGWFETKTKTKTGQFGGSRKIEVAFSIQNHY